MARTLTPTAQEIAEKFARANPHKAFAYTADGNTVGVQVSEDTYQAIASLLLTSDWATCPYVLVNGKEPVRQWIPVQAPATLALEPGDLAHSHDGPPDDRIPDCPVCHYPGWQEDEIYEAQRLIALDLDILDILDILDGVSE